MSDRIVITGAGIISAIGNNQQQCMKSLKAGSSGIGEVRYLTTEHKEFPVGEVKMSNRELCESLGINTHELHSRTSLLGMIAVQEAMAQARLDGGSEPMTLISGTTVGGMDVSEQLFSQGMTQEQCFDCVTTHTCGSSTNDIAAHFGNTFNSTITPSTACSSALNAITLGYDLIKAGLAQVVVAGGSECLTLFHLNGFKSLMILDTEPCKPFDMNRKGLNLGEGAAYVVLESEAHARRRNAHAIAHISGYGNACDAFHQTASSPNGEGAFLAMSKALKEAHLKPQDIDYINAHGTGTPNNDQSESAAILRLFGYDVPPVSSTKTFTGHTTSASGSIETVISLLAIQGQFLPPNLNWSVAMEDGGILPIKEPTGAIIKNVMCNSFGFGGNDSSLILSKVSE
ncbi:MAG: beta-ketoacyl-[Muribaculaceae bacterium]|nr:beta-ketoacyl-[acyl-carrier-protein] synthase family protein [Muribaculaceae bacterium]